MRLPKTMKSRVKDLSPKKTEPITQKPEARIDQYTTKHQEYRSNYPQQNFIDTSKHLEKYHLKE